jgi:hypothetical protein
MKFFFTVIFVLFLFSCSNKDHAPKIISSGEMKEVMWDMMRADIFVNDFVVRDNTKNKLAESEKLYEEIFLIHKIDRARFNSSLKYYQSHPEAFQPVLDSLAAKSTAHPSHPFVRAEDTGSHQKNSLFNKDSLHRAKMKVLPVQ